jgi:hypothetical protein
MQKLKAYVLDKDGMKITDVKIKCKHGKDCFKGDNS